MDVYKDEDKIVTSGATTLASAENIRAIDSVATG